MEKRVCLNFMSLGRRSEMAKKFPIHPVHPERICWGCDKYCPADSMSCGNGADRTQHPSELWGDDWAEWGPQPAAEQKESVDN